MTRNNLSVRMVGLLVSAAVSLGGCSTKPRNFSAGLAAPVENRVRFEQDFRTCRDLVLAGRTGDFKGAAATALATGAGTLGAGAAMAGTGMVGIGMSGTAAAAAVTALPVVGVLAGFGVSRAIRGGRERKYKRAMSACLAEYGYAVSDWSRIGKRDDAAMISAQSATQQTPAIEPVPVIDAIVPD